MREFITLLEAADDIQKKGFDKRDLMQKYQDIIDHPETEEFIRQVAQRKLDKLKQDAEEKAEYAAGTAQLPALNMQVTFRGKPLPQEEWGDIYLRGNGKILRFQQVLQRVMPLKPFRIDFSAGTGQFIGDMTVTLWFHPEDEPEIGAVKKAVEAAPSIWGTVSDDAAKYHRGGMSQYYVFFYKYKLVQKKR